MSEKKIVDETEARIFTLSDVQRLLRKKRGKILQAALLGGIALFGLSLLKPPKYRFEATFKEGIEKSGSEGVLAGLLGSEGLSQPQASALMKSFQVLKPLVARMGLQAEVNGRRRALVARVYKRLKENWRTERGKALEDLDPFVFRNVHYEEETALSLFLCFDDATHFTIYGRDKKPLIQGILGEEVKLSSLQFILTAVPKELRLHFFYDLQFKPWVAVAKQLRGDLEVKSNKLNKSIYDLVLTHRDRRLGVTLLNGLMEEYRNYLKRDHDQVAKEQLLYLEKKQDEIYQKMSQVFDEHVIYLTKNLRSKGSIGWEWDVKALLNPHQRMIDQLLAIEIELMRIEEFEKGEKGALLPKESSLFSSLKEVIHDIQGLREQRDLLELSLERSEPFSSFESRLETRQEELREIRLRRETAKKLLETTLQGQPLDFEPIFDTEYSLANWASHLCQAEGEERQDIAEYLENHIRLLSLREKMLQERLFYDGKIPPEFEGIDLPTARTLFVDYNHRLDGCEAALCHFEQLKEEIQQNETFEISSLSSVLTDPLSQGLIAQAGQLLFRLKDEKHRSEKEGNRWRDELLVSRKILGDQIEQLYKVEELNAALLREKIKHLQQVTLDCINRCLSVLYEQIEDSVKEHKKALLQERDLLEKKMDDLRASLVDFPEKWRLEKWIQLKETLSRTVVGKITELIESKTISHHLHHVESKPLDFALLPELPQSPRLFGMGLIGAFAGAFFSLFFFLMQAILRGFPTSLEKLRAMGLPLLGEISSFCDGPRVETLVGEDLDVLRQLSFFLERLPSGKVVALITGQGPDYSYALVENLARISLRSLVVRCDFHATFQKSDLPGLLQIWNGEIAELPIRSLSKGVDLLTTGGFTPYGVEMVQSKAFQQLLAVLKEKYDYLFLIFRSPLETSESMAALSLCDKAVVTVTGEPTEVLTPFVNWAYDGENSRLTFMTAPFA